MLSEDQGLWAQEGRAGIPSQDQAEHWRAGDRFQRRLTPSVRPYNSNASVCTREREQQLLRLLVRGEHEIVTW